MKESFVRRVSYGLAAYYKRCGVYVYLCACSESYDEHISLHVAAGTFNGASRRKARLTPRGMESADSAHCVQLGSKFISSSNLLFSATLRFIDHLATVKVQSCMHDANANGVC